MEALIFFNYIKKNIYPKISLKKYLKFKILKLKTHNYQNFCFQNNKKLISERPQHNYLCKVQKHINIKQIYSRTQYICIYIYIYIHMFIK